MSIYYSSRIFKSESKVSEEIWCSMYFQVMYFQFREGLRGWLRKVFAPKPGLRQGPSEVRRAVGTLSHKFSSDFEPFQAFSDFSLVKRFLREILKRYS